MNLEQEHIDLLILHFLENTSTPEEEEELRSWVKADPVNAEYLIQQQKIFAALPNNIKSFDTESELQSVLGKIDVKQPKTRKLYYAIASIAAAVVLTFGIWIVSDTQYESPQLANNNVVKSEKFIATDSIKELALQDSSIITLATNSTIEVDEFDSTRNTRMNGTAFFDISKDPQKPFQITVDFLTVTVLGTSFEIEQNPLDSSITVSVVEGKVRVNESVYNTETILVVNELCTFRKNVKPQKEVLENMNFIAWKTGNLKFEGTPLSEAILEMETYYQKDFSISSKALQSEELFAEFDKTMSFEDVKTVLSLALQAQVSESEGRVVIQSQSSN